MLRVVLLLSTVSGSAALTRGIGARHGLSRASTARRAAALSSSSSSPPPPSPLPELCVFDLDACLWDKEMFEFRNGLAKYAAAAAPPPPPRTAALSPLAAAARAAPPPRSRTTVLAATRAGDDNGEEEGGGASGDGGVLELTSLEEFDALLAHERLVMLKVYGANCPKCKAVAPRFEKLAAAHAGEFACAAVSLSAVKGAYSRLEVSSVPLFIAYCGGERGEETAKLDLDMLETFAAAELTR